MRVLQIVSHADAQSIPFEVARFLGRSGIDLKVAAWRRDSEYPAEPDGIDIVCMEARSAFDVGAVYRLRELVRTLAPDVIHVHHTGSALVGALVGRLHGIPAIVKTEHNDHRFQGRLQTAINAVTFAAIHRVLTNSDCTRASFFPWERWLSRGRAFTVYNGVDFRRIDAAAEAGVAARRSLGFEEDDILFAAVGRLVPQKNYPRLLEAFSQVSKDEPRARLVIAGAGSLRDELGRQADRLGISEVVVFLGGVSREEVYRLLGASDVFVVVSLWEGFCNAMVEAMAAGLPVIASDIATLREVGGDGAQFADPRKPEEIAEKLGNLCRMSPDDRREAGRSASRYARSRYDIAGTAEGYIRHYHEMLGKSRA